MMDRVCSAPRSRHPGGPTSPLPGAVATDSVTIYVDSNGGDRTKATSRLLRNPNVSKREIPPMKGASESPRTSGASRFCEDHPLLEPQQLFVLVCIVTIVTSAVIVSDEARRRALDARVLSALWILEPGGSLALLRFFFGDSVATEDVRHALSRLEHAGHVAMSFRGADPSYRVTATGLARLERGGLGLRELYDAMSAA